MLACPTLSCTTHALCTSILLCGGGVPLRINGRWLRPIPSSLLGGKEREREGGSEPRRKVAINKVRMAEGAEIHAVAIGSGDGQRSVHSQQETRVNGLVRPPHAVQARRKDPMEHC